MENRNPKIIKSLPGNYEQRPDPDLPTVEPRDLRRSNFLFRASALWWSTPALRLQKGKRQARENERTHIPADTPAPLQAATSLAARVGQPKQEPHIHIYLDDESEASRYGSDPYLSLDFIPNELEVTSASLMKSLNIVGLNYPHYHYGGGEDTITFTVQWYGHKQDRDSVIAKCRRLEALTKADGWRAGPPEIQLLWSNEDILFNDHTFLVEKVAYTLKNFQLNAVVPDPNNPHSYTPFGLLPIMAEQKVTLKRIASQLEWNDIGYPNFINEQTTSL